MLLSYDHCKSYNCAFQSALATRKTRAGNPVYIYLLFRVIYYSVALFLYEIFTDIIFLLGSYFSLALTYFSYYVLLCLFLNEVCVLNLQWE